MLEIDLLQSYFTSSLPGFRQFAGRFGDQGSKPLSLYRERRVIKDRAIAREGISIHSPYTGRDVERLQDITDEQAISIHSPYTGRDEA